MAVRIRKSTYVGVQSRGTFALPASIRKRHGLDRPGAQLEVTEREDGVIELRPHVPVPASQAWFWSDRWQAAEREVDDHVDAGNVQIHGSADAFLDHLDDLGR